MTMKMWTYSVLVVLIFSSCASQNSKCSLCGDFNLLSFNKSEINTIDENDVKAVRNLNLDEESGMEHFTIWSWNETQPDSAWTECIEKEIDLGAGQLSLREDGTWTWALKTTEFFKSSPFFGNGDYLVEKEQVESGVWRYINENHQFIELETVQNEINGLSTVSIFNEDDQTRIESPFHESKKFNALERVRRFEFSYLQTENKMELRTLEDDHQVALDCISNTSYSLTEGNIVMTLSANQNRPQLASKLK